MTPAQSNAFNDMHRNSRVCGHGIFTIDTWSKYSVRPEPQSPPEYAMAHYYNVACALLCDVRSGISDLRGYADAK